MSSLPYTFISNESLCFVYRYCGNKVEISKNTVNVEYIPYMIHVHWKSLNYSKSVFFADDVVQSRCHLTQIRWLQNSITSALSSRVAFLGLSGSFLIPFIVFERRKMPDDIDYHTK